jgi:hypothetical protein
MQPHRERCDFCRWRLVSKTTERQARPLLDEPHRHAHRIFRCDDCGNYAETPVSRRHEITWTTKPKPGPLEDQLTIYDDAR